MWSETSSPGIVARGALVCALALGVLTACAAEGEVVPEPDPTGTTSAPPPERPEPPSGQYYLDADDQYYANVTAVLEEDVSEEAHTALLRLLRIPMAQWLLGEGDVVRVIEENYTGGRGDVPLFVLYNIPHRDLGGEAGGGAADAAAYRAWVELVSTTLGERPAVVVLEPDALAGAPDLDPTERTERLELLGHALTTFEENNPEVAVYLDAGHSRWRTAERVADLIREVDPDGALVHGIALNVANQRPEDELAAYAADVSDALGRELYVLLDSAMNGSPDTADLLDWCNAEGERVGTLSDTWFDADELVEEAFIKPPGESDGRCGTSTEPAGTFDHALILSQVGAG